MSNKRRSDGPHMSREEFEARDDDSGDEYESGKGFARADEDTLAKRKIVRVKRSAPTATAEPSKPSNNPFASFSSLKPSTAPSSTGFSFFPPAPPASAAGNPIKQPAAFSQLAPSTSSAPPVSSTAALSDSSELQSKLKKLNAAFLAWTEQQIVDHPLSNWKDGLQDYIKFANQLIEKYADTPSAVPAATSFKFTLGVNNSSSVATPAASLNTSSTAPSTAPEPSKAFSFSASSNPPVNPTAAPATSSANSAPPSSDFSFGGFKNLNNSSSVTGVSAPPAPFSFTTTSSAPAASFSFASAPQAGGGNESDDEGEPILEPEKILKNENDKDEVLHEVDCKLFRFDKGRNEWIENGKGSFRITQDETKAQRMLVRNMMGRIVLNANFYEGMKFTKSGKNGIRFMAVIDDSGELKMVMIKVKIEMLDETIAKLENGVASVKK